ncbi:MAG: hypothetical protein RR640_06885, partial [Oscillospiraceae bacterium]
MITVVPEELKIIILIKTYEFDVKKAKTKKIYDCVDKQGIILYLNKNSGASLIGEIQKLFEKKGLKIDSKVAQFLANRCGSDMLLISNEVDKLACYKTVEVVTKEDIISICHIFIQANIFDLPKMIVQSNYNGAI